jgi:hypothetical protein
MKYLKILGLAAVSAMALAGIAATASATTYEIKKVTQNKSVTFVASLEEGTSALVQTTTGGFASTCTSSKLSAETLSPFSANSIGGPITELFFSSCTNEKVEVHKPGSLSVAWKAGTTHGTLTSSQTEIRFPSPFGTLSCSTGAGTDIGVLTGVASGQATIDIKAVINCGFLVSSALWEASYVVTSPEGLGVEEVI